MSEEKFIAFSEGIKTQESFIAGLSNDNKLEMYALFKQATVGDCNTVRPGMMDFKGKAKWDAWESKKGMSKEDAMVGYVKLLEDLEFAL